MSYHFIMKEKGHHLPLSDLDTFIQNATTFMPLKEVQKDETHVFATGEGAFLLVFLSQGEFILEAYSRNTPMIKEIRDLAIQHFKIKTDQAKIINMEGEEGQECQEPNCTRPATKDYKGRKVCADHYDWYKEKEFQAFTHYDY